ncbi:MAG: bifunctional phosphoribosyl-AMP cyclohydrolase/phosphoribosyl-ATP diphosphatase HisIE [Thermodesulfobacteriota bacterium]
MVEVKNITDIRFDSRGLVPAIAQDLNTGEVLMLAYMNTEALEKTLWSGKAHYWSRSRKKLWLKGETSGNFQAVSSVYYDCDGDTLLLKVDPAGPACHTGERSCFYRALYSGSETPVKGPSILTQLYGVMGERKKASEKRSYVASLFSKGPDRIIEKIKEESAEFIEAAGRDGEKETVHELVDLWFHTMALLSYKDIALEKVFEEFSRRFGTSGIDEKKSRKE